MVAKSSPGAAARDHDARERQDPALHPCSGVFDSRLLLRCVSPVGVVQLDDVRGEIAASVASDRVRLGAMEEGESRSYNLTVQEEVLLAAPEHDTVRAEALLMRVAAEADRLELVHLPGEDRPLEVFREELLLEGGGQG